MFHFGGFPSCTYVFSTGSMVLHHGGFPIRTSPDQLICSSPRLIAACHVLHRLLMPRHSPCALYSLTFRINLADSQLNYAGNHKEFDQIVLLPFTFRCCSTIKLCFLSNFFERPLCCLAYHFNIFVQFSRCNFQPLRSEISSQFLKSLFPSLITRIWWARVGSNHRPYDYQSYALAS